MIATAHGDVDPAMVGTWETSGVNAVGPWKLTWEIRADGSYFLTGTISDSGVVGSGDGRWHTLSNITRQTADGTYSMSDANHMIGTGPLGSAFWTRVREKNSPVSAQIMSPTGPEWNPFEDAFSEPSGTPADVSQQLAADYENALLRKDKTSRNRLEKTAQGGIGEAQVRLGMLLQKEGNPAEAVSWYSKAAQQENIDGMRALGSCYRDGVGVTQDAAEAIKWYRKASDQGDGDADSYIGGLYHNGRGVTKDDSVAVSWFRKGADKGSTYAIRDLAACYWTGTGVEKSAREAIKWWKLAADKGDTEAKENLKEALEKFDEFGQPRRQSN